MLRIPGFEPRPYSAEMQRVKHPGSLMSYDAGKNLGDAFVTCFGDGVVTLGGYLRGNYSSGYSFFSDQDDDDDYSYFGSGNQVNLITAVSAPKRLVELLQLAGTHVNLDAKKADKAANPLAYRISQRSGVHKICDTSNEVKEGWVSGFNSKKSPFRVAAGRVDPSWVARFDTMLAAASATRGSKAPGFAAEEFMLILKETRSYAIEVLNNVKVPVTDANVTALLELMFLKGHRVVTESFKAMPYLKRARNVDENLALLVGEGWDYLKLLTLNVAEMYPASLEELEPWAKAPTEWLATFIA